MYSCSVGTSSQYSRYLYATCCCYCPLMCCPHHRSLLLSPTHVLSPYLPIVLPTCALLPSPTSHDLRIIVFIICFSPSIRSHFGIAPWGRKSPGSVATSTASLPSLLAMRALPTSCCTTTRPPTRSMSSECWRNACFGENFDENIPI